MQPASATDAIGTAFTYTRRVLAPTPFRAGRFFKLAFAAAVTQASFLSVSFSYPLQGTQLAFASHARHAREQLVADNSGAALAGTLGLGVLAVFLALAVLFVLAYTYLLCRARATLFDLVVFRGGRVRAGWGRVGGPALRYCGLYLLAMLLFLTVLAAVIGPVIVRAVKLATVQGSAFGTSPAFGSLMLTMVGLVWVLLPIFVAVDALLQDFILPALVLDHSASIGAAFGRLGRLFRRSPGQLLLFVVLRTVVAFGVGLALGLLSLVAVGIVALGAYAVGRLLYSALWPSGLAGHTVFFAVVAGMALVVALLYLACITAVYGVTGTFKASYAAWFYAGYYPELAAALAVTKPDEEVSIGLKTPATLSLQPEADIW